jgi:hypothetical protein
MPSVGVIVGFKTLQCGQSWPVLRTL